MSCVPCLIQQAWDVCGGTSMCKVEVSNIILNICERIDDLLELTSNT